MKRNPSAVLASLSSGRSSHDIDVLGSVQVDQVRYSVVAVLHEARRQDLMCVWFLHLLRILLFTFVPYFGFGAPPGSVRHRGGQCAAPFAEFQ